MQDLISRQAAIDAIKGWGLIDGLSEGQAVEILEDEEKVPSAQPKIVRCKDCKWKQGSECVRFAEARPFPDDFCSRAERRKQ